MLINMKKLQLLILSVIWSGNSIVQKLWGSMTIRKLYITLNSQPILHSSYECIQEWYINKSTISNNGNLSLSDYVYNHSDSCFNSVTAVKQSIRKGLILVNGIKANNQHRLQADDYIQFMVRSHVTLNSKSHESELSISGNATVESDSKSKSECKILWEDEYLAIVLKPQGLPVFNSVDNERSTNSDDQDESSLSLHSAILKALLNSNYKYCQSKINDSTNIAIQPMRRPRMVHRLDKGTGGLVLVAKTHPALTELSNFFATRQIKKTYRAMVVGKMDTQQGQLSMRIDSKPSITDWQLIREDYYSSDFLINENKLDFSCVQENEVMTTVSTIELFPHTGRKHQIRRHLDSIGHPIIGDKDYWFSSGARQSATQRLLKNQANPQYTALQLITPICLFATGMEFTHPFKVDEVVNVSISEPDTFISLREKLKQL